MDAVEFDRENVEYIVIGRETCPTTAKQHLQGFIQLKRPRVLKKIQKIIGDPVCHIEPMRGTGLEASNYCKKDGDFIEWGTLRTQGARTDLRGIMDDAIESGVFRPSAEELRSMSLQQIKTAEKYVQYSLAKRNWKTTVYWFFGPTGSGKTKTAYEMAPNAWISGSSGKYWDGYCGQEDVILDDFRPQWIDVQELLKVLDRYPYTVNKKYGSQALLAKRVFITCPYRPSEMYSDDDTAQIMRRITEIRQFGI